MIQPTQVFLDANIYFTAFAFEKGISSVIFSLARKGHIRISTIPLVLKEADRNLKQAGPEPRNAFHRFLPERSEGEESMRLEGKLRDERSRFSRISPPVHPLAVVEMTA